MTFGFEQTSYTGLEEMQVTVCIVLQAPASLNKQVILSVTSEDISATGKQCVCMRVCV